VEANASVAEHRQQVQEDAAEAEVGKGQHLQPMYGPQMPKARADEARHM
jgi:hypothetical protein